MLKKDYRQGQSLIELLVGITIGVLFITAALGLIAVSLRIDFQNKFQQTAAELNEQLIEQLSSFANSDWHNIADLTRSTTSSLPLSGTGWFLPPTAGATTVTPTAGDVSYSVSFTVEDVYRSSIYDDTLVETPGIVDPSTLKIVATTEWQQSGQHDKLTLTKYLTRTRNRIWRQTDWSGAIDASGIYPPPGNHTQIADETNIWRGATLDPLDIASGSLTIQDFNSNMRNGPGLGIDTTEPKHYAWNDVIGWIDFAYPNANPVIVGSTVSGVVSSTVGLIALDCARTPAGNICGAPATFSVNQDGSNILDGYAWNSSIGWISFNSRNCDVNSNGFTDAICGGDDATTANINYGVALSGAGVATFSGWAWNDVVGWISFNCANAGTNGCGSMGKNYYVKTQNGVATVAVGEITSATFDTERVGGAAFNTIMWLGSANGGTVQFKIATSNCANGADNYPTCDTGDWNYVGPDSGNNESYYEPSDQGVQARIVRSDHNNKRYLRYIVYLLSDSTLTQSPTVDDVIINWSL